MYSLLWVFSWKGDTYIKVLQAKLTLLDNVSMCFSSSGPCPRQWLARKENQRPKPRAKRTPAQVAPHLPFLKRLPLLETAGWPLPAHLETRTPSGARTTLLETTRPRQTPRHRPPQRAAATNSLPRSPSPTRPLPHPLSRTPARERARRGPARRGRKHQTALVRGEGRRGSAQRAPTQLLPRSWAPRVPPAGCNSCHTLRQRHLLTQPALTHSARCLSCSSSCWLTPPSRSLFWLLSRSEVSLLCSRRTGSSSRSTETKHETVFSVLRSYSSYSQILFKTDGNPHCDIYPRIFIEEMLVVVDLLVVYYRSRFLLMTMKYISRLSFQEVIRYYVESHSWT